MIKFWFTYEALFKSHSVQKKKSSLFLEQTKNLHVFILVYATFFSLVFFYFIFQVL